MKYFGQISNGCEPQVKITFGRWLTFWDKLMVSKFQIQIQNGVFYYCLCVRLHMIAWYWYSNLPFTRKWWIRILLIDVLFGCFACTLGKEMYNSVRSFVWPQKTVIELKNQNIVQNFTILNQSGWWINMETQLIETECFWNIHSIS